MIDIGQEEQGNEVVSAVVICSPLKRPDKCFYYAPYYNLNRFETAQGLLANNHFNAITSAISFKGVFYVMSLRFGEGLIRTSTTTSLNRIRKTVEGWKKGEIDFPLEFRDLDQVHMIPMTDLGRMLIILVSRSVELSNTQYSLLQETGGKFFTLGSEWIGALVKYPATARCLSEMFAANDEFYVDTRGLNNDECEYFVNGIINNDRLFIQSYVFDTTFEIDFDFEKVQIDFIQQEKENKMHVTSNPGFAFHDDVLPGFTKNAVSQPLFKQGAFDFVRPLPLTIVSDNNFTSLQSFDHISTFEADLTADVLLTFDLTLAAKNTKIFGKFLEFQLTNNQILLGFEAFANGSYGITSSFFNDPIIFNSSFVSSKWSTTEIKLEAGSILGTRLEIRRLADYFNEETGLTMPRVPRHTGSRFLFTEILKIKDKRIRIFKYNDQTIVKKFFYFKKEPSQLLVILSEYYGNPRKDDTYGFIGTNEKRDVELDSPTSSQLRYTYTAVHAVVTDKLHIFGGRFNKRKVARLDECEFIELPIILFNEYESLISAAVSFSTGSSGYL